MTSRSWAAFALWSAISACSSTGSLQAPDLSPAIDGGTDDSRTSDGDASSATPEDASLGDTTGERSDCPAPRSDMCSGPEPSYERDIVPILDRRCNNCHAENNDGGPWPLGGYEEVSEWTAYIMNDLLRCTMPPADAGVSFPDDERQKLMAWFICGAHDN